MKLNDLITAFAEEIKNASPLMESKLDELQTLPLEDDRFMEAIDDYSTQAQRMGEAAEMVGFPGLQLVCNHIIENTVLLASQQPEERTPTLDFLRMCTPMMVHYLENIEDPSCVYGMIDLLCAAPSPMQIDQAMKITYQLGGIPQQLSGTFMGADDTARPVLATQADIDLTLPKDADSGLLDSFFQEAPSQAQELVQIAKKLVAGEGFVSDIVVAKRIAHTLKGSSATIGIRGITTISHHLEDILEHFESDEKDIPQNLHSLILDAAYCLEQIIDFLSGSDDSPEQILSVLQAILDTANRIDKGEPLEGALYREEIERGTTQTTVTTQLATDEPAPSSGGAASSLRVDMDRVEELFRISGEVMVHGASVETQIKGLMDASKQLSQQNLRIQKRLFELEGAIDTHTHELMHQSSTAGNKNAFDVLEMHEYSELHSVTNALMEEVSDARMYVNEVHRSIADLNGIHLRQQQSVSDMQYLVLSTRMAAVNSIASRLQRNIRNTCQATGKLANLVIVGGDTLIDTDVLSKLTQPLMHLLRNAVDHGIESPEVRQQKGKSETGQITLSFSRKGQQVEMICSDDGKGLDHAFIFQRAVERGIVQPDEVMTDDEIAQLILRAGFSTKDEVSEISGRGVGMDVVREWAQQMNGSIRIASFYGKGSTITMRFAASLSTSQSLIVRVNDQKYAISYTYIEQALASGVGKINFLDGKRLYHFNDMSLPFEFLHDYIGSDLELTQTGAEKPLNEYDVIIININNKKIALAVDELVAARDLLIKTPKRYAHFVSGISGLSILGDGSVAVNLDLASITQKTTAPRMQTKILNTKTSAARKALPHILVVDDALSVRNSLKQLVEDMGMVAITARDGMEAVERLMDNKPDVVLTDLEMPNLNGVELTTYIRNQDTLKDLPVIMITSRSQAKHRELADQAGVDHYLTKPYNDTELLKLIRGYISKSNTTA